MNLQIYARRADYANETHFHLVLETEDGKRLHAKPVKLEFLENLEGLNIEPFLTLSGAPGRQFLPALAEALAKVGYRAESSDAGELLATKKHLQDMRDLVFNNAPRDVT